MMVALIHLPLRQAGMTKDDSASAELIPNSRMSHLPEASSSADTGPDRLSERKHGFGRFLHGLRRICWREVCERRQGCC